MESYILWKVDNLWKVFDPVTLEEVATFKSFDQAVQFIKVDKVEIKPFFLTQG
jgi:hypothetical protein